MTDVPIVKRPPLEKLSQIIYTLNVECTTSEFTSVLPVIRFGRTDATTDSFLIFWPTGLHIGKPESTMDENRKIYISNLTFSSICSISTQLVCFWYSYTTSALGCQPQVGLSGRHPSVFLKVPHKFSLPPINCVIYEPQPLNNHLVIGIDNLF